MTDLSLFFEVYYAEEVLHVFLVGQDATSGEVVPEVGDAVNHALYVFNRDVSLLVDVQDLKRAIGLFLRTSENQNALVPHEVFEVHL